MNYNLRDLATFETVAKLKSFNKAAKSLDVSKAVISTRISNLEKTLGLTLFARTTRDVNLTTEGTTFLRYCAEILKNTQSLDDFIAFHNNLYGTLRIAIPPYFSRNHIVPYLEEFLAKYPHIELDITLTENPLNIIKECYDLQIRNQVLEEEDLYSSKIATNKKVLCASPEYLKKHGTPKHPRDLLTHNCLIFGENQVWRFQNKSTKMMTNLHDMSGNIRCDNGEIIKELVLCGLGITLKSVRDIEEDLLQNNLVALLPDYEIIHNTEFYAVYPKVRYLSPKIKAFIDFFQDKLRNL